MKNPFLKNGILDTSASLNKVIVQKMPTDVVKQELEGKAALDIFSTDLFIEEIKKRADKLGINIENIQEKMLPHYLEECLLGEDAKVRTEAKEILKIFGERLAVILLCLKKGEKENREQRTDWTQEHWNYWKNLKTVILVGGLANSYIGENLKYYAQKVFYDAKEEGYELVLGKESTYAGIRGCIEYLSHPKEGSANLIFDFGQSFTKRSYVQIEKDEKPRIHLLDNMLSKHVAWDAEDAEEELKEAVLLNNNFLNILKSTIAEVEGRETPIEEEIIISIANYVKGGSLVKRGGYGKLVLLSNNYADYLEQKLLQITGRKFKITFVHDGTAMAAGYRNYANAVCVSLGTAFGVGFPAVSNQIKAILWDFDGTIADTETKNMSVTIDVLKYFDQDIPALFPHIEKAAMTFSKKKIPMGICSQNSSENIEKILKYYGIKECFQEIIGHTEVSYAGQKPSAEGFLECLYRLEIADYNGTFVYIGDHSEDIIFAKNAEKKLQEMGYQTKVIAITVNYDNKEISKWRNSPDYILNDIADLTKLSIFATI